MTVVSQRKGYKAVVARNLLGQLPLATTDSQEHGNARHHRHILPSNMPPSTSWSPDVSPPLLTSYSSLSILIPLRLYHKIFLSFWFLFFSFFPFPISSRAFKKRSFEEDLIMLPDEKTKESFISTSSPKSF